MFNFILLIFKIIFLPLSTAKREILTTLLLQAKELSLCHRKLTMQNKRIKFSHFDRLFYSIISILSSRFNSVLVKPETVLKWVRKFTKQKWNFSHKKAKPGRPPVPAFIKQLVLRIKNNNIFMRTGKIRGELLKLGIDISVSTIRRILRNFRKSGKVREGLTWSRFIKSHMHKLFAMDFFTVDPLFGKKRFYVFFIMYLKTREIVQFSITTNPDYFFVRNQLCEFSYNYGSAPYLIHDGSGEFISQDYTSLGIKNIRISPGSPNMNAYAERFIGSVRRELLDNFIIFSYDQLFSLMKEYVSYYNNLRPHQGIEQQTPLGYIPETEGKIVQVPVLGGLWNHYTRVAV